MSEGCTGIVFENGQTSVLIVQRHDNGVWVLPGGGIDPGESPEQAVIREIEEETGLVVRIIRQVGEYTPINRLSTLCHVFECEITGGSIRVSSETRKVGFYAIDQFPEPFFPLHRDWIEDALLNDAHVHKKPISRLTYLEAFKYMLLHPIPVIRFLKTRIKLRLIK